jgi:hypothetical protein
LGHDLCFTGFADPQSPEKAVAECVARVDASYSAAPARCVFVHPYLHRLEQDLCDQKCAQVAADHRRARLNGDFGSVLGGPASDGGR